MIKHPYARWLRVVGVAQQVSVAALARHDTTGRPVDVSHIVRCGCSGRPQQRSVDPDCRDLCSSTSGGHSLAGVGRRRRTAAVLHPGTSQHYAIGLHLHHRADAQATQPNATVLVRAHGHDAVVAAPDDAVALGFGCLAVEKHGHALAVVLGDAVRLDLRRTHASRHRATGSPHGLPLGPLAPHEVGSDVLLLAVPLLVLGSAAARLAVRPGVNAPRLRLGLGLTLSPRRLVTRKIRALVRRGRRAVRTRRLRTRQIRAGIFRSTVALQVFGPSVALRDVTITPLDVAVLPRRHGGVARQLDGPALASFRGCCRSHLRPVRPRAGRPAVFERGGAGATEDVPVGHTPVVGQGVGNVVDTFVYALHLHLHVLGVGASGASHRHRQSRCDQQAQGQHNDAPNQLVHSGRSPLQDVHESPRD